MHGAPSHPTKRLHKSPCSPSAAKILPLRGAEIAAPCGARYLSWGEARRKRLQVRTKSTKTRSSPRRFWKSRSRSSILNGAGAASGRAPEQRLCRCPHSKRARLKPRPRLGLGFGLVVVAPPSPPSFCQFRRRAGIPSQPRKLCCPDGFSTLCHCLCVCPRVARALSPELCLCVCAALCYWICCL